MKKKQSQVVGEPDRETGRDVTEKALPVSKSFMALGPTLHYSHQHVQICWLLGLSVFTLACLLWSKMTTGYFWAFQWDIVTSLTNWRLDRFALTGISVFEYPWQILVLGLLMGIFCIVPILIAQLMSFGYSLPFIGAVFLFASLPGIAVTLVLSCMGVACRPLRFRSRIIAIALCMAPQLIYWGYFGGARGQEPIGWGMSFAPWVCAWLVGLALAGMVLGVGHVTRYKPGLIWTSTALVLVVAVWIFEEKIGFNELAFQLYVNENNPGEVSEFHSHSITEVLDARIVDPGTIEYLSEFFYPSEPIPFRKELKEELQSQLSYDRWPSWIADHLPPVLRYQEKREWLNEQYDLFIAPSKAWWMPTVLHEQLLKRRKASKRMAIALYYRALLSEYAPNPVALGRGEVLSFYNDYPFERSRETWYRLFGRFPDAPEALEARWRIAKHWAGSGQFEKAQALLSDAREQIQVLLDDWVEEADETDTLLQPFHAPSASVMTRDKLTKLRLRVDELLRLIGSENRSEDPSANSRLAIFVMLNPYALDYDKKLEALLQQLDEKDRLRDNVLLAMAKLKEDQRGQEQSLLQLHQQYMGSDGGMEALYELGRLKIRLYQDALDPEKKNKLLVEARTTLESFMSLYANSMFTRQVQENLAGLPNVQ